MVYKDDLGERAVDKPYSAVQSIVPAFYTQAVQGPINPKVVQGLSMAIDRDTITKTVLQRLPVRPVDRFRRQGCPSGTRTTSVGDVFQVRRGEGQGVSSREGGGVPGNKISIQFNAERRSQGLGRGGWQQHHPGRRRRLHR